MRFLFISFLIFSSFVGNAQLLDASQPLFTDEPFFNIQMVKEQKIKSISAEMFYKRDYEKMNSRGTFIQYNFDERGRLINQVSTFKKYGGLTDTAIIYYEYDNKDRLITKRKGDSFGFYSLNYEYDDSSNVTKETYCRDINASPWQIDFRLEKQFPIAVETFENNYLTPSQAKVKFLNNLGIAYKEMMVYKDKKGRVTEKFGRLIMTSKADKISFEYDAFDHVVKRTEFSDVGGEKKIEFVYKYNEGGLITEVEKLKNNVQVEYSEFLFEPGSPLFTAKLTRDLETKLIDVVKYQYGYYE